MSIAKEYLGLFKPTCTFTDFNPETNREVKCYEAAVAVYVSDDEEPKGRYVCEAHAKDAELNGDGPVFWQKVGTSHE